MSKSKHTEGPWAVTFASNGNRKHVITSLKTEGFVCEIVKHGHMDDIGDSETVDGNAKLIAAAPELLQAIILCVKLLSDGYVDADVSPTMKIANAVIKKATE